VFIYIFRVYLYCPCLFIFSVFSYISSLNRVSRLHNSVHLSL